MQELEDIKEESLMMANKADAEDCAKRLLCEIARWGAIYCPFNLSLVVALFLGLAI